MKRVGDMTKFRFYTLGMAALLASTSAVNAQSGILKYRYVAPPMDTSCVIDDASAAEGVIAWASDALGYRAESTEVNVEILNQAEIFVSVGMLMEHDGTGDDMPITSLTSVVTQITNPTNDFSGAGTTFTADLSNPNRASYLDTSSWGDQTSTATLSTSFRFFTDPEHHDKRTFGTDEYVVSLTVSCVARTP